MRMVPSLLQMTSMRGPVCASSRWSPDGTKILFHSSSPESPRTLYLLYPNDGTIQRLTRDRTEDAQATWSRDGRFIYFASDRTGQTEIWKMSTNGQSVVQITKQGGTDGDRITDRRVLYYAKNVEGRKAIWRMPVNSGEETPVVAGLSDALNFAVGDQGLYFVAVGDSQEKTSIDFFDFKTHRRTTLVGLGKLWWYGVALSPDQKSLLYSSSITLAVI